MRFNREWAKANNKVYNESPYEYESETVNKMADDLGLRPVTMVGLMENLKELRVALDNIIATTDYFYLGYDLDEIAYHWDMNDERNKEKVANMRKVVRGIEGGIKSAYAYLLAGLGERLPETKDK